jgi:hypothetical protein
MIHAATAIYMPNSKSLMLVTSQGHVTVHESRARILAHGFARAARFFADCNVTGSVSVAVGDERLAIPADELGPLADAIGDAFTVRDHAKTLLKGLAAA